MNPQLFGVEHILYIVISTILGAGGLLAAKKWAKELKWKPRTTTPKTEIQNPKSNIQNPDLATQEETAAFLADMREALATIGQPPPSDYIITD